MRTSRSTTTLPADPLCVGGTTISKAKLSLGRLAAPSGDETIKVSGTLLEPKVRPDLEGIAKAKLKQKVDEKKDELKQKLQDKLQDKLKGLFGGG